MQIQQNILWRQTQEDGTIPVSNFNDYAKEKSKKGLKDFKSAEEMAQEKFMKHLHSRFNSGAR